MNIDIFGDETIFAVDLPGHAAGQMGLFVQTKRQKILFVADGVAGMTQPDGQGVAIPGDSDVTELAVGHVRPGGNGRHAAMNGVDAMGLVEEIGRCF